MEGVVLIREPSGKPNMCFRTVILVAAQGGLEWCFVAPDVLEAQRKLEKDPQHGLPS